MTTSPHLNVLRARKRQRGTAVFVVVMVTTLLTAIGVFAVRAASQIDMAAGYSRQAGQTMALAEYTSVVTAAVMSQHPQEYYYRIIDRTSAERCRANEGLTDRGCYKQLRTDLEEQLSDTPLLAEDSLGPNVELMGDAVSEMTDIGPTGSPVAGQDLGKTHYYRVLVTTTAQVRPQGTLQCDSGVPGVTGQQVMRSHVILGPILQ